MSYGARLWKFVERRGDSFVYEVTEEGGFVKKVEHSPNAAKAFGLPTNLRNGATFVFAS